MFNIKLTGRHEVLDDRYVVSMGPRQLKTMGVWEYACNPLKAKCKAFKTPEEAVWTLTRYGYITKEGNPGEALKRAGITGYEVIPV